MGHIILSGLLVADGFQRRRARAISLLTRVCVGLFLAYLLDERGENEQGTVVVADLLICTRTWTMLGRSEKMYICNTCAEVKYRDSTS